MINAIKNFANKVKQKLTPIGTALVDTATELKETLTEAVYTTSYAAQTAVGAARTAGNAIALGYHGTKAVIYDFGRYCKAKFVDTFASDKDKQDALDQAWQEFATDMQYAQDDLNYLTVAANDTATAGYNAIAHAIPTGIHAAHTVVGAYHVATEATNLVIEGKDYICGNTATSVDATDEADDITVEGDTSVVTISRQSFTPGFSSRTINGASLAEVVATPSVNADDVNLVSTSRLTASMG